MQTLLALQNQLDSMLWLLIFWGIPLLGLVEAVRSARLRHRRIKKMFED